LKEKTINILDGMMPGTFKALSILKTYVEVANKTPAITHWIPTREHKIVNDFIKAGGHHSRQSNHTHKRN
jgi:hypothetical protein